MECQKIFFHFRLARFSPHTFLKMINPRWSADSLLSVSRLQEVTLFVSTHWGKKLDEAKAALQEYQSEGLVVHVIVPPHVHWKKKQPEGYMEQWYLWSLTFGGRPLVDFKYPPNHLKYLNRGPSPPIRTPVLNTICYTTVVLHYPQVAFK
jgi:hypothetical protein